MIRIVHRGALFLVLALLAAVPAAAQEATPAAPPEQRLIELPDARVLAMSPDGRWLAAGQPAAGRPSHLCIYDVATLAERACGDLSALDAGLRIDDVVWSPDSTRLAFGEQSFQLFVDGDLWMMDAMTGAVTNLTDDGFTGSLPLFTEEDAPADPIFIDVAPAWAPDGQSIVFSRSPLFNGEFRGNQIARVDLATGEVDVVLPVTLDTPGVVFFGLVAGPESERLYLSVMHPDRDHPMNGLYEFNQATGATRRVMEIDPELGGPAILEVNASGEWGIVIFPLAAAQFSMQKPVFALVHLPTGQATPLEAPPSEGPAANLVHLATFSPDGTRLLMAVRNLDQTGTLVMRAVGTGEERIVAEGLSRVVMPALGRGLTWAANGTAFVPNDLKAGTLVRVAAPPPPPAPPQG